jgi:glycosyltransferase involved in cell wall biosynthesis
MKILVVTTKSPYPLYEGRALRTYNLIKQAARQHEIYLYSFVQTPEEVAGVEHMRTLCEEVYAEPLYLGAGKARVLLDLARDAVSAAPLHAIKYRSARMRARIRDLLARERIDLVHLDMLHLGDYADVVGDLPVVLVEHNVEWMLLKRRADSEHTWLRRRYFGWQTDKLRRYEARMCARADEVVAVSELDAQELRRLGAGRVTAIPNGVDTAYFDAVQVAEVPDSLVFVGGLTWFPNRDAIGYFCEQILPLVAAEVPGVTLTVVGKNPDARAVREIAGNPRVRLTGLVDDVRPLIAQAAAYVVPLRVGGGTRLKILDALSMRKAIISTAVGCEGLEVAHGEHLLVADEPQAFAAQVVSVLRDRALARRLGAAGRMLVERRYEWRVIAGDLMQVYAGARERHARRPLSPGVVGQPAG